MWRKIGLLVGIYCVSFVQVISAQTAPSANNGWVDAGRVVHLRTNSDRVGIGTNNPTQKIEIDGGLRLNTATPQPVCNQNIRGTQWFKMGSIGDSLEVCKMNGVPFATKQGAQLPTEASGLSCAQDSSSNKRYCFGVGGSTTDGIVEYNPITGSVATKSAVLPTRRNFSSCAEDTSSNKIYCFGGDAGPGQGGLLNNIIEYTPSTDSLIIKSAIFPTGRSGLSCAQNSFTNKIYCFGGKASNNQMLNQILEYNPSLDSLSIKAATLPTGRSGLSCVEDISTHKIYCFGGEQNSSNGPQYSNQIVNQILEYDPVMDVLIVKTATLPIALYKLSCASSMGNVYCIGGRDYNGNPVDFIVRYDPLTDTSSQSSFPTSKADHSCAQDSSGGKIYCFGGGGWTNSSSDIFEVTPIGLQWVPIN